MRTSYIHKQKPLGKGEVSKIKVTANFYKFRTQLFSQGLLKFLPTIKIWLPTRHEI